MKKSKLKNKKKNDVYITDWFREVSMIAQKMKKSTLSILKDMIVCKKKYKASIDDYFRFEMYRLNKFERQTILTEGLNNDYIIKYNDPKYIEIFINKVYNFQN